MNARYFLLKNALKGTQLPRYSALFKLPSRCFSTTAPLILQAKENINVRTMTKKDLQMVIDWAVKEGWNPCKYQVEPLYAADPGGYKLLEIDGNPVASLASVRYSKNFAILGMYIVKPEYRGQGYGKLLWDFVMGNLKAYDSIGLYGVMAQVENYKRAGFRAINANTRWRGITSVTEFKEEAAIKKITSTETLNKVIDYDGRIFSTPRETFLTKWLAMPESHALSYIENSTLKAYGVINRVETGHPLEIGCKVYRVGPLFADDANVATKIYRALCHCVPKDSVVYLDTVESNPDSANFAERFGLKKISNTVTMYKGQIPPMESSKIFGLTSLDIG